jgi:hypothetical protein
MNNIHARRSTDRHKGADIDALIAAEDDPKQRGFLIILNSINSSMVANTEATRDLAIQFDNHLSAFEKKAATDAELLNQGRGAWKILAWVFGGVQAGVLAAAVLLANDLKSIHQELIGSSIANARIESRITALEKK